MSAIMSSSAGEEHSRPNSRATQSRPGSVAERNSCDEGVATTTNGVTQANDLTDEQTEHPHAPQHNGDGDGDGDALRHQHHPARGSAGGATPTDDPFGDGAALNNGGSGTAREWRHSSNSKNEHPSESNPFIDPPASDLAREASVYSSPEHVAGRNPFVPFHRRKSDPGEKTGTPGGVAPGIPPLNLRRLDRSGSIAGAGVRSSASLERKGTLTSGMGAEPGMQELQRVNSALGRRASLHSQLARSNPRDSLNRSSSMLLASDGNGASGHGASALQIGASSPSVRNMHRHRSEEGEEASDAAAAPTKVLSFQPPRAVSPGEGGYSTEDREAASQGMAEMLFLPSLQREQYIPVRVARDKIKQVLSEMAQMKTMHLAALETMEKQHAFLKAQMEAAVAAYTKKLTGDYNNRVTALEAEYKKRLSNLNNAAMSDLHAALEKAKGSLDAMERGSKQRLEDKDRELKQERNLFQMRLEGGRQQLQQAQAELEETRGKLSEREQQVDMLRGQVSALEAAADDPDAGSAALVAQMRDHNRQQAQELDRLRLELQARDEELHTLRAELREARRDASRRAAELVGTHQGPSIEVSAADGAADEEDADDRAAAAAGAEIRDDARAEEGEGQGEEGEVGPPWSPQEGGDG